MIQFHDFIIFCISLSYIPPWRAMFFEIANIAPFCVLLVCDKV